MASYTCPHCNKPSISLKQKYLAGKWGVITCRACSGKSAMFPIGLALMSGLYLWDIFYFSVVAIGNKSLIFIGIMIVIWLILDLFTLTIPLVAMKKKPQEAKPG